MARQERGIRTRRAVLEAAASVFAERGYDAAAITEILARAGVTKGALYFHFASKEELVRGIFEEQVAEQGYPPQDYRLQELVDVSMALACRLPGEVMLQAGAQLAMDAQIRRRFAAGPWELWAQEMTVTLEQAKDQGELLPHVVPEETGRFLVSAWTGAQVVSRTTAEWADLEERISVMFSHVLPAITHPAILPQLDTTPERGRRVLDQVRAMAREQEGDEREGEERESEGQGAAHGPEGQERDRGRGHAEPGGAASA